MILNRNTMIAVLMMLGLINLQAQQKVTIEKAVQLAEIHNPFLKTAAYNVSIANADVTTAGLRPNLALNNQTLQLASSRYFAEGTGAWNAANRQVWWQLTKSFRLAGQRKHAIETASGTVNLEQRNYLDLKRIVASEVATQWLAARIMQNKLELLGEAQTNIDSLVRINDIRLKNLAVTSTEVLRTRILSEQFSLHIRSARNSYRVELRNLKLIMGVADSVEIETEDPFRFDQLDSLSLDSLFSQSLQLRTDYIAAQAAKVVSESNIKLQKSLAYPAPELGMIWNPQNTVPYLGFFGTIEIPIFSRNQGEIQKSTVIKEQSEQHIEATRQRILSEVQVAFNNYNTEKENLKRYDDILLQTENVLSTVRYAYLHGGTTLIDFLEAQRTWFETRQLYADALHAYRLSSIELMTATGLITQLYQ